ncbi:MAG TPA: hypothetical protein VFX20_08510 [Steroidobacteraceae bacterium]|nr:hypothetical protein [Steroidobacteraceae bacterium]
MSLRIAKIIAFGRQAAPYLAIELILPGGSLIALVLWILKNRPSMQRRLPGARLTAQLVAALRPSAPSTL